MSADTVDKTGVENTARTQRHVGKIIADQATVTSHLANERTFLSWVRTALGIITLGFAISRFGITLTSKLDVLLGIPYSLTVGIALVLFGGGIVLLAFLRYRKNQKMIFSKSYMTTASAAGIFSVVFFLLAVFIFVRILLFELIHK